MTFRVPKIKSCCCFSLETVTKLIGCFQMLIFVAALALPIILDGTRSGAKRATGILQNIVYESTCLNFGVFSIVMLVGASKRDRELVLPWIMLQTLYLLSYVLSLLCFLMYSGLMDYSNGEGPVDDTFFIVYLSLSVLVVYNFYRELKESSEPIR
ncbi:hypothetical protein GE061_019213 [Apolygus lucorum]|uniref:MARVEL domain-containing protein n=1 Tax=Apolygus lucorum TaxID=248454 RepID=A0A6A4JJG2_APOLU|nr:hypothetical protein GE061_019213 [Apolygus lucorum]